jgi:hypothetical protein
VSFANLGLFGAKGWEVAAADLFQAAGIAFLATILLDTFDTVLSAMAHVAIAA